MPIRQIDCPDIEDPDFIQKVLETVSNCPNEDWKMRIVEQKEDEIPPDEDCIVNMRTNEIIIAHDDYKKIMFKSKEETDDLINL